MMRFMLITNDPVLAGIAERSGVARLFVDLEKIGKWERQGHLNTHISRHTMEDVGRIRSVLQRSNLLVRLNPLHSGSSDEIDAAIAQGAEILMLPMFRSAHEVAEFCRMVDARVPVIPLVETADAVAELTDIIAVPGVDEIYVGLNDLHLDLGLVFMFEPLASGMVDEIAAVLHDSGVPFGFGGVARVGEGAVPGEMVLTEHARLGSTAVVLSRTFSRDLGADDEAAFALEVDRLRTAHAKALCRTSAQATADSVRLREAVGHIVEARRREAPV